MSPEGQINNREEGLFSPRPRHEPWEPTGMIVSSGGGIDDLQNRYYELNLVVLWPNYDCLTLMHHTRSSLDHLGVDQ